MIDDLSSKFKQLKRMAFKSLTQFVDCFQCNIRPCDLNDIVLSINATENEEYTFNYPIGFNANYQVVQGSIKYSKQDLLERLNYLALTKLPIKNVYQLVTITETMLNNLARATLLDFGINGHSK